MKRVYGVAVTFCLLATLVLTPMIHVSAAPSVLITAIQTAGKRSASEEFIQISNLTTSPVDISGWRLEYFAATPKSWDAPSRTIQLKGTLAGGADYIAASTGYRTDVANVSFGSTLSGMGGHVRLSNGATQQDLVGWGTASKPLGSAAPAPGGGEVLERDVDSGGSFVNTNNNSQDFSVAGAPSQAVRTGVVSGEAVVLELTELLPNPASPVSDATGEFIELFNPSGSTVQLAGYKLLAGNSLSHSFTFTDQTIEAGSYKAFYSSDTKIALSNSGGRAQLLAPDGQVLDETSTYDAADDGSAWAWDGSGWQWTAAPSPNATNTIASPASSEKEKAAAKKTTAKAKASTSKAKAAGANSGTVLGDNTEEPARSLHSGVLAGVGGLALLYGAYEYRQDITNFYRRLRGNRKAR